MSSVGDAINRITGSQKAQVVAITGALNGLVKALTGAEPTEGVMLIVNIGAGLLVLIQGVLDLKWGSNSDGTKKG